MFIRTIIRDISLKCICVLDTTCSSLELPIVVSLLLGIVEVRSRPAIGASVSITYVTYFNQAACDALAGFVPYAVGGDGDAIPRWYVGYWPTESTGKRVCSDEEDCSVDNESDVLVSVVVVHEGTDPTQVG
jgi:hypothetical protein